MKIRFCFTIFLWLTCIETWHWIIDSKYSLATKDLYCQFFEGSCILDSPYARNTFDLWFPSSLATCNFTFPHYQPLPASRLTRQRHCQTSWRIWSGRPSRTRSLRTQFGTYEGAWILKFLKNSGNVSPNTCYSGVPIQLSQFHCLNRWVCWMICYGQGLGERPSNCKNIGNSAIWRSMYVFLVFPIVAQKNIKKNNGDIRRPNGDICQPNGDIRRPVVFRDFLKRTEMAKA